MDKANNRLGYQVGNPLSQRAEVRVGAGAGAGVKAGFRFDISISTSLRLLQTFAGVLHKKFVRALFSRKPPQTIYQQKGYKM